MTIRPATHEDLDAAIAVWRHASTARRPGVAVPDEAEARVRGYTQKSDACLIVADDGPDLIGMALVMQGLADYGAGNFGEEVVHYELTLAG